MILTIATRNPFNALGMDPLTPFNLGTLNLRILAVDSPAHYLDNSPTIYGYCPLVPFHLRAVVSTNLPGVYHWWIDDWWCGIGETLGDEDSAETWVCGGTPGEEFSVAVTCQPGGFTNVLRTTANLCPHAHDATFGFTLPPVIRLDNDDDAALGHSENDIARGVGPHISPGICIHSLDEAAMRAVIDPRLCRQRIP